LLFGQLIIMTVYLPIFALSGIEGRMFHPMAITVVLALGAAMILSVTFVPAAVALFVTRAVPEHENRIMDRARGVYRRLLDWVLRNRPVALSFALLSVPSMLLSVRSTDSEYSSAADGCSRCSRHVRAFSSYSAHRPSYVPIHSSECSSIGTSIQSMSDHKLLMSPRSSSRPSGTSVAAGT
jgi:hypothetical protein